MRLPTLHSACPGLLLCGLLTLGLGCSPSSGTPAKTAKPPLAARSIPAKTLSGDALRDRLDQVIAFTGRRHLSPQVHNAWQVVHGILAYGHELHLNDNGKLVPALDYLLAGGQLKGWQLVPGEKGLESIMEPGSKSGQGHEDQWLGYLSQCGLDPSETLIIKGQQFQIADLINQAKWDVREGVELTWTLMALSSYVPLDEHWKAKDGADWSLERIIAWEAEQDVHNSACGGSHRLYAMTIALNRYLAEGGKPAGGWLAAERRIDEAVQAAHDYQQTDGTFSTNFFHRAGTSADVGLKISTTGHALEFLAVALPHERLAEPWVARAAAALCEMLEQTRELPVECGGLYHAAHGLILYRQRIFGPPAAQESHAGQVGVRRGRAIIK